MNLDIGCGRNKKEGYMGIDIAKDSSADILASVVIMPIRNNIISEISCRHLVEHLYPEEAQRLFDEIYRVLKEGGVADLKIDRDWSAHRLLNKDPTHKHRYSRKELVGMLDNFEVKRVRNVIYRFGFNIRKKIVVHLEKGNNVGWHS